MVRTGARAAALVALFASAGIELAPVKPPAPRLGDLSDTSAKGVLRLYESLGGVLEAPKLRPGSWDLALSDGRLVELDEELHFNRYRVQVLGAELLAEAPWREEYVRYSSRFERGGTGGRRWTNPSSERLFGGSDADGIFGNLGAARWKQRALYDSMKDAVALDGTVALARLSVHDSLAGLDLDDVLRGRASVSAEALLSLLDRRTMGTPTSLAP